jgi:hypothetical protein
MGTVLSKFCTQGLLPKTVASQCGKKSKDYRCEGGNKCMTLQR